MVQNNPANLWDILGLKADMSHCKGLAQRFNVGGRTGNPDIDTIGEFLRNHEPVCKAKISCEDCGECEKSCGKKEGVVIRGCAGIEGEGWWRRRWFFGRRRTYPEFGTCIAHICVDKIDSDFALGQVIEHELTHCKQYCTGPDYPTWDCATCLCKETQAYHESGECATAPFGQYDQCLRRRAQGSCKGRGHPCAGKTDAEMDAIMTAAFLTSCKGTGNLPPPAPPAP